VIQLYSPGAWIVSSWGGLDSPGFTGGGASLGAGPWYWARTGAEHIMPNKSTAKAAIVGRMTPRWKTNPEKKPGFSFTIGIKMEKV
jgi:hypothetical protein